MQDYLRLYIHAPPYIDPGPQAQKALEAARFRRYMALSDLKNPREGKSRYCAWCNGPRELKGNQKYCQKACQHSAEVFCRPQSREGKGFRFLVLQQCVCLACGEDFSDEIKARIDKKVASSKAYYANRVAKPMPWEPSKDGKPEGHFDLVQLWWLMDSTGKEWQVDHIVPLHRGGDGIGFKNTQVICVPCHLKKTAKEAGER